jgi:hypothetical protein
MNSTILYLYSLAGHTAEHAVPCGTILGLIFQSPFQHPFHVFGQT